MQTLTSQYDREPLEVADEIPTFALRHVLGWTHVATPADEVEAMVREKAAKAGGYTPAQIEQTVAAALWLHAENLAEYTWVMAGLP
jgi:hypothetical protein